MKGGKYYAITEIDGESREEICEGFGRLAALLGAGGKVKFRAFPSEDAARRYLETGCSYVGGHTNGSFVKTSFKGSRVSSEKKAHSGKKRA